MKYNELGTTGIRVSEIGAGCEGFLEQPIEVYQKYLDTMEEAGANIIDMYTPDPDFREKLGIALEGRREKFVLQAHLGSVWKDGQYKRSRDPKEVRDGFEEQLRLLRTDHFEIGMFHYSDALSDWRLIADGELMEYAKELKKKGVIRAIGLSSHNPDVALAAVREGAIDVLMFSVNPCYDLLPASEDVESLWDEKNYEGLRVNMDPKRQELYDLCQAKGVGITVMKAFGGGDLLDAELSPAGAALTENQCIHYALSRPGVISVIAGIRSMDDLTRALAYEEASEEEKDYAEALDAFPKISWEGHCMYCGHCAPCPVGIRVAEVSKFRNLAVAQGSVPETVREHYALLKAHGGDCIACGTCETRCPFKVAIMDTMKDAARIFGY